MAIAGLSGLVTRLHGYDSGYPCAKNPAVTWVGEPLLACTDIFKKLEREAKQTLQLPVNFLQLSELSEQRCTGLCRARKQTTRMEAIIRAAFEDPSHTTSARILTMKCQKPVMPENRQPNEMLTEFF